MQVTNAGLWLAVCIASPLAGIGTVRAEPLPEVYVPRGQPVFEDLFRTLDAGPDRGGGTKQPHRWRTIVKGGDDAAARSLSADTYFGDATTGVDPFATGAEGLTVTATRRPGLPFAKSWNSGFLSTKLTFSFFHGYAEVSADLPTCVKGAWPAPLWLLPVSGPWPAHGEIDAPETTGKVDPTTGMGANHWAVLSSATGKTGWGESTPMTCLRGWHTYGVLWRADQIGFYLDRKLVASTATPADYTEPTYLVMDLIVGGAWPGPPDPSLQKVQMRVRRVSVWAPPADTGPKAHH